MKPSNRIDAFGTNRLDIKLVERTGHSAISRYAHILVPTCLAASDRAALLLALEMAAIHRAKLTVLHVLPAAGSSGRSLHWLDAIDGLHQTLANGNGALNSAERARLEVKKFIEREAPAHSLIGLNVHSECRLGEIADMIAQFADEASVDLVVMSSGLSRWWLPGLSARARRVLRLTRKQVIIARRELPEGRPHGADVV